MNISREEWKASETSSMVIEAMHQALREAWELGYRTGAAYMARLKEPDRPPLPPNPWGESK